MLYNISITHSNLWVTFKMCQAWIEGPLALQHLIVNYYLQGVLSTAVVWKVLKQQYQETEAFTKDIVNLIDSPEPVRTILYHMTNHFSPMYYNCYYYLYTTHI